MGNQPPNEFVKGCPHVVGELADADSPGWGRDLPDYAKDVFAGLTVEVTDEAVIYALDKGTDPVIEEGQVLICPPKSLVAAIQRVRHALT